jgi:hypothetical protein
MRMPSWPPPPQKKVDLIYCHRVFDFIACLHSPPPNPWDTMYCPTALTKSQRKEYCYYLPASGGLRHYATRQEVPGSIPGSDLGNFQVFYSFCPHSVTLGSSQPLTNVYQGIYLGWGGKVWPARGAENSIVLVVPNFNVRLEVQHQIPPPPLWDFMTCYWKALALLKLLLIFLFTNSDTNIFSYRSI